MLVPFGLWDMNLVRVYPHFLREPTTLFMIAYTCDCWVYCHCEAHAVTTDV